MTTNQSFAYEAGQQFFWLTLLRQSHQAGPNAWVCKCACGREVVIENVDQVRKGTRKACGCGYSGTPLVFEAGQKFFHLTLVRPAEFGRVAWYCQCDCGTEIHVRDVRRVRLGDSKSCGCENGRRPPKPSTDLMSGSPEGKTALETRVSEILAEFGL